jgi:hypothetical protein
MNAKFLTAIMSMSCACAFTGSSYASTLLFYDNYNTAALGPASFNASSALSADQSGTLATLSSSVNMSGWEGAFQRGNGGTMLLHANNSFGGADTRTSLDYNFASIANSLDQAVEFKFNMSVSGGADPTWWAAFAIGSAQNQFVNAGTNRFSSLFRDNGGTQQFASGTAIGESATFSDGNWITLLVSNAAGTGSAFQSDGATDVVKMFVNGALTNTWTNLNFGSADGYVSFQATNSVAQIDNFTVTAIPETSSACLTALASLAWLRRRRSARSSISL